jgi:hypothetical protein
MAEERQWWVGLIDLFMWLLITGLVIGGAYEYRRAIIGYAAVILLLAGELFNETWRFWLVAVLVLILVVLILVFFQLHAIITQLNGLWHEMRGENKWSRRE